MRKYQHPHTLMTVKVVAYGVNVSLSKGDGSLTAELTEEQAVEFAWQLMWWAGYRALRVKRIKGSTDVDITYEAAHPHQFQHLKDAQDAEEQAQCQ